MNVLITAGPTREPIDAVRFLSNRSSGRVGVALAEAAAAAGHAVTLLLGYGVDAAVVARAEACAADAGEHCRVFRFGSTADLAGALAEHMAWWDVLLMAAAVSDYRPAETATGKLPRQAEGEELVLRLTPTPDLVAGVAQLKRDDQRVIAFALEEPEQLADRAVAKMHRKGADAILANPLETMDAEAIDPTLFTAGGAVLQPGRQDKAAFASWLVERASELCGGQLS